jgi:hypothetical protein
MIGIDQIAQHYGETVYNRCSDPGYKPTVFKMQNPDYAIKIGISTGKK